MERRRSRRLNLGDYASSDMAHPGRVHRRHVQIAWVAAVVVALMFLSTLLYSPHAASASSGGQVAWWRRGRASGGADGAVFEHAGDRHDENGRDSDAQGPPADEQPPEHAPQSDSDDESNESQRSRQETQREIEARASREQELGLTQGPANRTLNFGQIFAINLARRSDRWDRLQLLSAFSELDFTRCPGVSDLPEAARPPAGVGMAPLQPSEYGVFRAHADVWRHIVKNDITTALILEDDVDYDTEVKNIVPRVLATLNYRLEDSGAVARGQGWDVLMLGACYEEPRDDDEWSVVGGDAHNIPRRNFAWVEAIFDKYLPARVGRQRILQRVNNAHCSHAYVVTQRGARRLLHHLNNRLSQRLDIAMIELVRAGSLDSFVVVPPVFVQHKTTVNPQKDSDVGYAAWPLRNWGLKSSTRAALKKYWSPEVLQR